MFVCKFPRRRKFNKLSRKYKMAKRLQKEVMAELMAQQSLQAFTYEEIAAHNKPEDSWVLIDGLVYDVTKFAKFHPGGKLLLLRAGGTDATKDFKMVHRMDLLRKPAYKRLIVGRLAVEQLEPAETKKLLKGKVEEKWMPLSDHYWLDPRGTLKAPYYNKNHFAFLKKVRKFIADEIVPNAGKWDEAKKYPLSLHEKAYEAGIYGAPWPKEWGGTPPDGWDCHMDMIYLYELARCGSGGIIASWFFTASIGLPPILNHGSTEMKETVGREVITGKSIIALAITEPWGGSDVQNLRCTAIDKGDHYLVNGEKKFITSGMTAKYFTAAVRTDPSNKGLGGISLLLIEANRDGVGRRKLDTMGWWAGNTAYLTFEDVKVPKKNLIGTENQGFRYIMENFNHERFGACVMGTASCHHMISECIRYGRVRHTFGKRLLDHQVIRHKIADMSMKTEALYAMCEQIAYHMNTGTPHLDLGGRIALCKVLATKTMEHCARETAQIFGGNSYQRGGQGEFVERLYREVRVNAIGGGSEEILMDLGIRMAKL